MLNNLHIFTDFTTHYNNLDTKLQGCGNVASSMFGYAKAFEKKLAVFITNFKEGKLKYFPQLLDHEEQQNHCRSLLLIKEAKNVISERLAQFEKLDATLQFVLSPQTI